ncbi:MAG: redoxin family protein [Planctomycetaceae bacterium]|nr:redoxin family protein [Planctomycetaceae bacterium]
MNLNLTLTSVFVMCALALSPPLTAEELTVAEQQKLHLRERTVEHRLANGHQITTVSGLAVLPDGKPAAGFKVGGWGRSMLNPGAGDYLLEATTDENGRFTLQLFQPFLYWLHITDPNNVYTAFDQYFELKEPLEPDAVRFQLQKGIPVEGIVIDKEKNEPIAGLSIWLLHDPVNTREMSPEEDREHEKKQQVVREVKTDRQGRFKFAALSGEKYMVSFDSIHDVRPPSETEAPIYTRTFTSAQEPIRLEFKIPTPWQGRLLLKDGSPAAFFPVFFTMLFDNGSYCAELVTDKDGFFFYYRAVALLDLNVGTFEQGQWFHRNYNGKELPPDPVFQLYSPLTAKGQLVRKSTGKPLANFKFACNSRPIHNIIVLTDANGCFELVKLHLDCKARFYFLNESDNLNTCSIYETFYDFTPTEPDKVVDLGVLELEETGRLEPNLLQNLPGKEIAIDGETLDGQVFDWKKYKGKVVLIDFWATWCAPCVEEIPRLKTLYEKYHGKGFEIVGISIDEKLDALKKGLEKHQFPWIILADEKRKETKQMTMINRFAISRVPCCILVGRDGKVISTEARGEKLEEELKRLFPE